MVVWYKTEEALPVDNSYYTFQKMRENRSMQLPAGWSRVEASKLSSKANDNPSDFGVFTHESAPNTEFMHPIPIQSCPLASRVHMTHKYLTFTTQSCFLFSGNILGNAHERKAWSNISNSMVPYCLSFLLVDASGQWAGMMYANFSDPKELALGQRCEIIIISGAIAHIDRDGSLKTWLEELKVIDNIQDRGTYEFYNVLCIERKGDVAYRKALGRVWKEAWQRQVVEEVDVLLG
jgi:hypothetical protein